MPSYSPAAQQVLALSRKEADRYNHNYVGTEHLLLGIIKLSEVGDNLLGRLGLDAAALKAKTQSFLGKGPETKMVGTIPYAPRIKKILALAGKEAKRLMHRATGVEHILLGMLLEADGIAGKVLSTMVSVDELRERIIRADQESNREIAGSPKTSSPEEKNLAPDFHIWIDPGEATIDELVELFASASELQRSLGGKGLQFAKDDRHKPVVLSPA